MLRRKRNINLSMKRAMSRNLNQKVEERNFKLKIGDKGEKVKRLQEMLNDIFEFYPSINYLEVDSMYGKEVFASVKRFQELMGIYDTGIVDSITWNKLQLIHSKKSAMKLNSNNESDNEKKEESGCEDKNLKDKRFTLDMIKEIQENLNKASNYYMGIPKVKIDGIYGEKTSRSIKVFNNLFGIKEESVTEETIECLKKASLGIKR